MNPVVILRNGLRRAAEERRVAALVERDRLVAEGWPVVAANGQVELDYAIANLLDALAVAFGWRP